MLNKRVLFTVICVLMPPLLGSSFAWAEDERAQYPQFLANSYVGLSVGRIDYAFSNSQLAAGFKAESIQVPHLAVRALLFGHEFNKYFSGQMSYMRPVQWVRYNNVNADRSSHSVWMNVAGLTLKSRVPVTKRLSVYGEVGLGLITRKGFDVSGTRIVKDAAYATLLAGAGVEYHLDAHWSLVTGTTLSPARERDVQPRTSFLAAGFNYTMRPLSVEQVERNSEASTIFSRHTIQVGYITNATGYGVNDFFSKGAIPVFWSANVETVRGASFNYQHNVFHGRRVFSLDWGTGLTLLQSRKNGEFFYAASLYPLLRFTLLRSSPADLYLTYSLGGPTFISKTTIDGTETGRHFTFQDFMGAGAYLDRKRNLNAEIRIMHYSNGNLFPRNSGITVPLGFNFGYAFR